MSMYINKCTKCGMEFETKNPKRVICPACLYQDRAQTSEQTNSVTNNESLTSEKRNYDYSQSASFGGDDRDYSSKNHERGNYSRSNSYNRYDRNDSYSRPQRSYGDRPQRNYSDRPQRSYSDRPQRSYSDRPQRNYGDRPQRSYGDRPQRSFGRNQSSFGNKRANLNKRPPKQKQLLISKEQLEQIEFIYKKALPLPNHDIHEVIGTVLGIEPRKVFFGINLVRQKMMLPKLQFPKRKLAVTPDQLTAIKMLYEPLLPLPPIGCHKLIAAQLKMDEWRVHVGIGLIRKEMGLDRWNSDRPDAPKEYKK